MDAIDRIYRMALQAFGRGRITLISDTGPVQKSQVKFNDLETIDDIPVPHDYGFTSNPPVSSDVLAAFLGGNRRTGMVISIGSQQYRIKNLQSGETAIYDSKGQSIYLTQNGIVINGAGLPLTVNNTPVVTVNASTKINLNTPELDVSGKIVAGGDITDNAASNNNSMANMRSVFNEHNHPVAHVQGGGDTVTSNQPNQQV